MMKKCLLKFKNCFEKIKDYICLTLISTTIVLNSMSSVSAVASPDTEGAKSLIKPWITAGVNIVQWVAVGVGIIYVGMKGVKYLQSTEEERQRMNVWGDLKKGIVIVIIIESVVEIFKVFGLNYS